MVGSMRVWSLVAVIAIVGWWQDAARGDYLLVTCNRSGEVLKMDPTDGRVIGRFQTGGNPHEVVVLPGGTTAATAMYGDGIYGKNANPGREVVVFNLSDMTQSARHSTTPYLAPHGLAVDTGRPEAPLLVASDLSSRVLRMRVGSTSTISNEDRIVAAVDAAGPCHWVCVPETGDSEARIAVTSNKGSEYLSVIDLQTDRRTGVIELPRGAQHLAATPDGRTIYAADYSEPVLHVVDVPSQSVTGTIALTAPAGWVSVTGDGQYVLAAAFTINDRPDRPGTIDVIDVEKGSVLHTIRAGRWPFASTSTPDGETAFVTDYKAEMVHLIDMATFEVTRSHAAPGGPESVVYVAELDNAPE